MSVPPKDPTLRNGGRAQLCAKHRLGGLCQESPVRPQKTTPRADASRRRTRAQVCLQRAREAAAPACARASTLLPPAPQPPQSRRRAADRAGAHQRPRPPHRPGHGTGPRSLAQDGDTAPQHFNSDGTETTRDLHTMRGRQGSCHFQGKAHLGAQEEGDRASPTPGKTAGVPGQEGLQEGLGGGGRSV